MFDPILESTEPTFRITTRSKKVAIIEWLEEEPVTPNSISEIAIDHAADSPGIPLDQMLLGLD